MPLCKEKLILLIISTLCLSACSSAPRYTKRQPNMRPEDGRGRDKIVHIASSYIGSPYRSGGTSRRGVDCSGLVVAVFSGAGIEVPRTSLAQSRGGETVSRNSLEKGDLVFFATTRSAAVTHVGIYIGGSKFVHASTRARRVRIDRMDLPYFKSRFVCARRY